MPNNMRPVQKKVFDNAFDFERYSEKFFAPIESVRIEMNSALPGDNQIH